jgi:HSP90 family molecular chaperone
MLRALPARLSKVRATGRLRASPCVVTDHESASLRRMMRMVEAGSAGSGSSGGGSDAQPRMEAHMLPKQVLEVNPAHAVVVRLHAIRDSQPELARAVAEQLVDNALIAAGLVDDSRTMLPRLASLVERVLGVPVTPIAEAAPRRAVGADAVEAGERLIEKINADASGRGGTGQQ